MLKRELSTEDRKVADQLEKDGVLKVFDGSPQEERGWMCLLLAQEGCTKQELFDRIDEEVRTNVLCSEV